MMIFAKDCLGRFRGRRLEHIEHDDAEHQIEGVVLDGIAQAIGKDHVQDAEGQDWIEQVPKDAEIAALVSQFEFGLGELECQTDYSLGRIANGIWCVRRFLMHWA